MLMIGWYVRLTEKRVYESQSRGKRVSRMSHWGGTWGLGGKTKRIVLYINQ